MSVMEAQIVHLGIEKTWQEVYAFACRPENMPLWASGLSDGLEREGDHWVARGPLGVVRVRFAEENDFGVMDHTVTMETGLNVNNAFRVVPNGSGAEIMFTVLKLPDMDDEQFRRDSDWVLKDLKTLKALLEA
ncbi:SRPBCC family protein [Pararhizobium gei]|uniref:SRPBCC family protein n=1 Tax=Pararhizobium gei TaxID=1395951 RepID=UPI0023DB3B01|nr:SRPBCC family protein [Rhizobium gei]